MKTIKNQKGVALLVMVIIIILTFLSYYLSGFSIHQIKAEQQKQTRISLKKAKIALISYAITHADLIANEGEIGYFPCPDTFSGAIAEGGSDGSCGLKKINTSGYFPWVSLETSILRDGSGACFWYLLSSSYKPSGYSGMINEDSYGMFQIVDIDNAVSVGISPEGRVIALVAAPGSPLLLQNRENDNLSLCGKSYGKLEQHLEGNGVTDNGALVGTDDAIDQFIHASSTSETASTPYNDRFITVTRSEVWKHILKRSDFSEKMENLTQALAMCIASYANLADNSGRRLPWPVLTDLGDRNNYRENSFYDDDAGATGGYSGRYPFIVADSNAAIDDAELLTDELFDIASCDALVLSGSGIGVTVDLENTTSEYRRLWNNWKDHFFYILSKKYEPSDGEKKECDGNNCILVNSTRHAAAVIFSGKRLVDAAGNDTLRSDKSLVADYLEDNKDANYLTEANNNNGNENYNYTDPQTETVNDIMYCIQDKPVADDLDVVECE